MIFFLSFTHPRSQMCITIYIFCSKHKKTDTHKQKTKETKENRKIKETEEEKEEENVFAFSTVSVENLTGYDYMVCEFALCNFNI